MNAETNELLLEAFLACRLILLDKSLALKPAGKGEAVQKISGNLVMKWLRKMSPKLRIFTLKDKKLTVKQPSNL